MESIDNEKLGSKTCRVMLHYSRGRPMYPVYQSRPSTKYERRFLDQGHGQNRGEPIIHLWVFNVNKWVWT